MEKIIQEKISADHLLYVSLKYTKTTDVMLNLIARWRSMIDISVCELLEQAKKERKTKAISSAPKVRSDAVKEIYKKNKEIMDTMELYEFFKRTENLEKIRENEFRKNVTLRILDRGKWVAIDMDKLKEYSEIIERFINSIKQVIK